MLLVSYSDRSGGAARAAFRLLEGLRAADVDARMLVAEGGSEHAAVVGPASRSANLAVTASRLADRVPLRLAPRRKTYAFSPGWAPSNALHRIGRLAPDVVHLHWINAGTIRIEDLAHVGRPLVWTLHDMWPFTGGCHYDEACGRHRDGCGACPLLGSSRERDLSRWVLRRKERAWAEIPLQLVTPSRWLAEEARASVLFRDRPVTVIPYGLDLDLFRPVPPDAARDAFGLPKGRRYLLFGAADPSDGRKGLPQLLRALDHLAGSGWAERLDLLVVGASEAQTGTVPAGMTAHWLGHLRDEEQLVLALCAADAVVVPSIQDNLPNMAIEALACGRPCVGFAVGGLPEIVSHRENGYLAAPFAAEDLAAGIRWVLEDDGRYQKLAHSSRREAEMKFDTRTTAQRYLEIYRELAGPASTVAAIGR